MKNILKVDSKNARLVMDRTFAKNAAVVGSAEYTMLQNARRDYPNYTVMQRQIKRNENKEAYRGLTYEYMESYIELHPNAAYNRRKYDEMRLLAECHSIRYPTIKKWFLATFPEVAEFGMDYSQYGEGGDVLTTAVA